MTMGEHKEQTVKGTLGTRRSVLRTLVIVASPFVLMSVLFLLAAKGIYVQFIYDLLVGIWQPWMHESWLKLVAVGIPGALVILYGFVALRTKSREHDMLADLDEFVKEETA